MWKGFRMLVISRKSEKSISIGPDTLVTFTLRGQCVKCKISAPAWLNIRRGEVQARGNQGNGDETKHLTLSRKVEDIIVFEELSATLKICEITSRNVKVGIEAPHEILVRRVG